MLDKESTIKQRNKNTQEHQRWTSTLASYSARYNTQLGSRDRTTRIIHPFKVKGKKELEVETEHPGFEFKKGDLLWMDKQEKTIEGIVIEGVHYCKSNPALPPKSVNSSSKGFWVFYRKKQIIDKNDDWVLLPVENWDKNKLFKSKLNLLSRYLYPETKYVVDVDFRKLTEIEILMKNQSKKTMQEMCKTRGLPFTGTKAVMADRLTEEANEDAKDPEYKKLNRYDKRDLKKMVKKYSRLLCIVISMCDFL